MKRPPCGCPPPTLVSTIVGAAVPIPRFGATLLVGALVTFGRFVIGVGAFVGLSVCGGLEGLSVRGGLEGLWVATLGGREGRCDRISGYLEGL